MSLRRAARFIFGLLLIVALLYRFDPGVVLSTIRTARPQYLALGVLAYSLTFLILSKRWRMILSSMGESLSLSEAYQAFAGGMIFSDLTPGRAGELSRPILIRDHVELSIGFASLAIDRFADILAIFIIGIAGMFLLAFTSVYLITASAMILFLLLVSTLFWARRCYALDLMRRFAPPRFAAVACSLDGALWRSATCGG